VSKVYERWGFDQIDTGPFEYVEALGKFLPDTDRPNEGVFALRDDDEEWIALRYDHTAPLARFAAEHWDALPKPYRRFAVGPVWRNEKPGPYRYREFIQCDADTVGSASPLADAEMVALAVEAMRATGALEGEFQIRVNSRRLLEGAMERADVRDAGQRLIVLRALDKLDRLGAEGVGALLGAGRRDESGDFTTGAGLTAAQADTLLAFALSKRASRSATLARLAEVVGATPSGEQGLRDMETISSLLVALGVSEADAAFDPAIVRGLEYYTGPVFEAELLREFRDDQDRPVRFGSVGGGGRYDDLVARFRGEKVPSTGFSVGISRLAAALALSDQAPRGPVIVLVLDQSRADESCLIVSELRAAGIAAELYLGSSGMRAQMKYADRRNAPAVVIIGEDERSRGVVTIKDLKAGSDAARRVLDHETWRSERPGQFEAPRTALTAAVRSVLGGGGNGR
jgi:histidyl-tRNA synthetase